MQILKQALMDPDNSVPVAAVEAFAEYLNDLSDQDS